MILHRESGTPGAPLRVVTQNDHAALAAELLTLWRREGLPDHPRRQEILFAAREHDNGWREADSAPHHDPASGRPHDFVSLPQAERRELWRRGVARHRQSRPYASLLIVEHASALHRSRNDPEWRDLVERWADLAATLAAETAASSAEVAADYRWIDLADTLSLAVSAGWSEAFERGGYRVEPTPTELGISPFPYAGATRFHLACRHIPDRVYASDGDLALELARARWRQVEVRVRPLDAG